MHDIDTEQSLYDRIGAPKVLYAAARSIRIPTLLPFICSIPLSVNAVSPTMDLRGYILGSGLLASAATFSYGANRFADILRQSGSLEIAAMKHC